MQKLTFRSTLPRTKYSVTNKSLFIYNFTYTVLVKFSNKQMSACDRIIGSRYSDCDCYETYMALFNVMLSAQLNC